MRWDIGTAASDSGPEMRTSPEAEASPELGVAEMGSRRIPRGPFQPCHAGILGCWDLLLSWPMVLVSVWCLSAPLRAAPGRRGLTHSSHPAFRLTFTATATSVGTGSCLGRFLAWLGWLWAPQPVLRSGGVGVHVWIRKALCKLLFPCQLGADGRLPRELRSGLCLLGFLGAHVSWVYLEA